MLKRYLTFIFLFFTLATVAVGGFFIYFNNYLSRPVMESGDTVVMISRGASFNSVTQQLAQDGLVQYPLLLKVYGRYTGLDRSVQAGEYLVTEGTTVEGLVSLIASGQVIQHSVTLVEGLTLEENLESWANSRLRISDDERRDAKIAELSGPFKASPEGLFFSDTYFYHAGDTDLSILHRAHQRLQDVLKEEWQGRQSGLPYKEPYEALVMASIIERETGVPHERKTIAGVFVRRLQKGMRLQSDPTVIYGMGERYKGKISRKDLLERTPYNTYRINGLPPTPIALVGRESIHAALHPAKGKELYFVARGDGSHKFSRTLKEHNRAVREYQLNRRSDYRSTPVTTEAATVDTGS